MSLRPNTRFREVTINLHSSYGGIGDHIARLTALRWVMKNQPHVRMTVYWHDYFVELAQVLLPPNEQFRYLPVSALPYHDNRLPSTNFDPIDIATTQFSLVDYAFIRIASRLPPTIEDTFYPKVARAPRGKTSNIIVAPCYTAKTRMWKGEEVNGVLQGIREMGYNPVLVGEIKSYAVGNGESNSGKLPEGLDTSLADNLINQLSLVETLNVINSASAIVGIDNGLLHLSACTDTPSVWGFTSVTAETRVPKDVKHVAISATVPCYGCQSKTYLLNHDFRTCLFGDYACLDTMKSSRFLDGLKKVLDLDT